MSEVGPAALTLASVRRLAGRDCEMFASMGVIAEIACLSVSTVKHHMATLIDAGYVQRLADSVDGHRPTPCGQIS